MMEEEFGVTTDWLVLWVTLMAAQMLLQFVDVMIQAGFLVLLQMKDGLDKPLVMANASLSVLDVNFLLMDEMTVQEVVAVAE